MFQAPLPLFFDERVFLEIGGGIAFRFVQGVIQEVVHRLAAERAQRREEPEQVDEFVIEFDKRLLIGDNWLDYPWHEPTRKKKDILSFDCHCYSRESKGD